MGISSALSRFAALVRPAAVANAMARAERADMTHRLSQSRNADVAGGWSDHHAGAQADQFAEGWKRAAAKVNALHGL